MLRTAHATVPARRRAVLVAAALACGLTACVADDIPQVVGGDGAGLVGGHVLMTLDGPLVGARVSIDHLEYQAATPVVRSHVGDVVTDATGYFQIAVNLDSGYFLVTTHGGQFRDYATGATVVLDDTRALTTILYTDYQEPLTTGLVTPISYLAHRLIVARTAAGADASLIDAHALADAHLDAHFGGLHWERTAVGDLAVAAPSPTDDVRAAFILAAWSYLARDLAQAAGSTVQAVNPYTLAVGLGDDLGAPPFDGNDGNARASGTGVQLGACPPPEDTCTPTGACDLGQCRSPCDAYANTPRTVLATAVAAVINDPARNHTGLTTADTLAFVRAIAANADPILFGDACIDAEGVDTVAPTLTWGASPVDGAAVRGTLSLTVTATDNVDPAPVVTWLGGLVDTDGAPASAAATVDTTLSPDGPRAFTARAVDSAGNVADGTRTVDVDNTAPALTVASAGFLVDGSTWWTGAAAPHLTGTATDAHGPITVQATVAGTPIATTTVASGAPWDLALPAASFSEAAPVTVVVRATDALGNPSADTAATSPAVRVDATAPSLDPQATVVADERKDTITFPAAAPLHTHATTGAVTLGTSAACPTVYKYAYLTDASPVGAETTANPVALRVRTSDGGVGLDLAGASYTVTAPGGATFGPFALGLVAVSGAPGSYDATADLRRSGPTAVPPIGAPAAVEAGTFTVAFTTRDRLGRAATVARCFTYAPLGPPLQVTRPGQAAAPDPSNFIRTLDYYKLDANPGPTSDLLTGTATGGVLSVRVANPTGDPAFVTVLPPEVPAPRYSKTLRTYLRPTTQATVSVSCLDADPNPPRLCGDYDPAPDPVATVTNQPIAPGAWTPSLRVHPYSAGAVGVAETPCVGCAPDTFRFDPGTQHEIVLGFAQLPSLALDVAGTPTMIDGYTAIATPGAPTVQACITFVAIPGGVRCTRVQNYRQYRSLASATVELQTTNGRSMRLDWLSAPSTFISPIAGPNPSDSLLNAARSLSPALLWTSAETYP
ncbi:MAG: hypothetical protein R3B06_21270 [Kofleriaceae bacterium]